jgi:hypothetical protein
MVIPVWIKSVKSSSGFRTSPIILRYFAVLLADRIHGLALVGEIPLQILDW